MTDLARLTAARHALAVTDNPIEVREIADMAEAVRQYLRRSDAGLELQNEAAEVRVLAERKLGQLLVDMANDGTRDVGRGGDRRSPSHRARVKLADLGLTMSRSSRAQQLARHVDDDTVAGYFQQQRDTSSEITLADVRKIARAAARNLRFRERAEARHAAAADALAGVMGDDRYMIRHGDFRTVLDDIPDGHVDAIVTDPPYPHEFLPLWSDLSAVAARLLRPGGLLLAYTGKSSIPEVLNRMSEHLTYGWMAAITYPGAWRRQFGFRVMSAWRPVVIYSNGPFQQSADWRLDWTNATTKREKELHPWQQGTDAVTALINEWTEPGDTICDPFLGTGTFGVAAVRSGRRFIGCELDDDTFTKARTRMALL